MQLDGPTPASPEFHLTWPEGEVMVSDPRVVERTVAELDERYAGQRRSVFVGIDTPATSLDVGLGQLHAALFVAGEDDDAFLSRGRSGSPEGVTFEFDDEPTELPASVCVERDEVLRAVAEFVATGERPACLDWQLAG